MYQSRAKTPACLMGMLKGQANPSSVSRTMRLAVPRSFDLSCRSIGTNLLPPQLCAPGGGCCAALDAARLLARLALRLQHFLPACRFVPFLIIICMQGTYRALDADRSVLDAVIYEGWQLQSLQLMHTLLCISNCCLLHV